MCKVSERRLKMGLSSSQARMLTLTARKSDLELRAQIISQRKINLAMQTEVLANDYNDALNNKRLFFATEKNGQTYVDFSYAALTSPDEENDSFGNYLVVQNGKYLASDRTEDYVKVLKRLAVAEKGADAVEKLSLASLMAEYNGRIEVKETLKNSNYFQEALQNGVIGLVKFNPEKQAPDVTEAANKEGNENAEEAPKANENFTSKGKYKQVEWSTLLNDRVKEDYDQSDDERANAVYKTKTTYLANQDKRLDLELNQIETQHKAIEQEEESVKKVIDNNIKGTFKIFS